MMRSGKLPRQAAGAFPFFFFSPGGSSTTFPQRLAEVTERKKIFSERVI
jgi:hypothetical protein